MLSTKYRWAWLTGLLLICTALYWPGMRGPFLFDDLPNLGALSIVDHVDSWRDVGIYLSQPRGFPGRPLAMLSFLLQKASWPGHPLPFRLANLGLHLLCGLLVYRLTKALALASHDRESQLCGAASKTELAGLLAAAAWLLNPIQISGVLLIVQRMTLLMALFLLLGLLAYTKGLLQKSASASWRGVWMLVGLGVCTVLSFLSKENGILLPLYALILDATVLRTYVARLPRWLGWWRRLLIWPTVLFILGYLLLTIPQSARGSAFRDFTLGQRLLTEPRILFDYLSGIFLPRFGVYGLYHDGFVVSRSLVHPWTTPLALIGVFAPAVFAFAMRRKHSLIALAVLWYLGGQVIESSTVMLELYFEHRNYLPIVGPFMAMAIGLTRVENQTLRYRLFGVVTLWLAAASLTTLAGASAYRSEDHLALVWATQQPLSIRAQSTLADRLYQHGQLKLSYDTIDKILHAYPNNLGLLENKAYLNCVMDRLNQSDMQDLITFARTAPYDMAGYQNVKNLRMLAQNKRCPAINDQSWKALTAALLSNPVYARGEIGGYLHYQLHESAVMHGDLNEAVRQLNIVYANDPNAEIPRLQAQYLASAGLYDQAISILEQTDYSRLPLLRRLLVDDKSINRNAIATIREQKVIDHGQLRPGT